MSLEKTRFEFLKPCLDVMSAFAFSRLDSVATLNNLCLREVDLRGSEALDFVATNSNANVICEPAFRAHPHCTTFSS